jgi:YD repeat-containing protein
MLNRLINYRTSSNNLLQAYLEEIEKDSSLPNNQIKNAGGLRIAKIEEFDPVSQKKYIKDFVYGENGNGAGYIAHQPSMKDYTYEYFLANGTGGTPQYMGYKVTKVRMFFPNSLAEMTFNGGSSVVYNQVTEYLSVESANGIKSINGKNIYEYTYSYPFMEYVYGTTLNKNSDNEWMQGQLQTKTSYKVDKFASYSPVQRTSYGYSFFNTQYIPYYKAYTNVQGRGAADLQQLKTVKDQYGGYKYIDGSIYSGAVRMHAETIETYNDNGVVTDRRQYTYDNIKHLQPTKIEITDGTNVIKTDEYTYTQDLTTRSAGEQKLLTNNQLNIPLIKKMTFNGRTWVNQTEYGLTSNIPVVTSIKAGVEGAEEERVKIIKSDNYGNPIQVEADGVTSFYLWAYSGTRLMAEITNATYSQITTALGIDLVNLSASTSPNYYIGKLRTGLPDSLTTTYAYDPLVGLTESVNPSGIVTYYNYDTAGRLKETYILENGVKKILQSAIYNYINQ